MARTFPETLSALRHARGISQRQAASELNISQALLSHYENGAREPGLGFVCRACDYYGVSADYILCRTEEADAAGRAVETARGYIAQLKGILDEAEVAFAEKTDSIEERA